MVLTGMMYHPVGAPDLSLAALKCHFFGAKANLQLQYGTYLQRKHLWPDHGRVKSKSTKRLLLTFILATEAYFHRSAVVSNLLDTIPV
jgi:hypothetical protein